MLPGGRHARAFVGVTDGDWFQLLAVRPQLDEVNFWQPGGSRLFRALQPGELFLFKLHSPDNFIVGGGVFGYATRLPLSLVWEAFGEANGVRSLDEMRERIEYYRKVEPDRLADYEIGCILLQQPFFLPRSAWIPVPADWKPNIVSGRTYDLQVEPGLSMFRALEGRLARWAEGTAETIGAARRGAPVLVQPRLGQGTFRLAVTDAYHRRCAVTLERTLPVLEAAHIRPFASGGEHRIANGLLLRRDLHTLFDRGYVTVGSDLRLEVSRRIREEFENGKEYYRLQGQALQVPEEPGSRPSALALAWHNENVFRG